METLIGVVLVLGIIFYIFKAIAAFITTWWFCFVPIPVVIILYHTYAFLYFKSIKFRNIKSKIQMYIDDCNALNEHISELKTHHLGSDRLSAGTAIYRDNSSWDFKRPELAKQSYAPNVYNCSRTVCDGARRDPFKYVCKYFNIKADEPTLEKFETMLNNFESAEEGKTILQNKKRRIVDSISQDIPGLIRKFSPKKLEKKLGFQAIDLKTMYFPKYSFNYVSAGGNSSLECDVVMDVDNLNKFVEFLSNKIKFKNSIAGQRALMTSKLRDQIKARDNFTCKQCGASIYAEPNLLLEIDHIIPLSKGGLTAEDNLQTLCWRCNRSKGAKMVAPRELLLDNGE